MKIIGGQHSGRVKYSGDQFKWWSPKVKGEGDSAMPKGSRTSDWRKIIILQPVGAPKTIFSMGFSSIFGDTATSDAIRRIEEGPFGMRMGPEDCEFFIVSNEGEVQLEFVECVDIDKSDLPLY